MPQGYDDLMARPAPAYVSEEAFLALPETTEKVELLDGEIIEAPSPSFYHQEIVGRLAGELRQWASAQAQPITVGQAPLDVRFAPGRILQPDLFVLFARVPFDHMGPLETVPQLCIEVISGRPSYDRFTKPVIYAEAGVQELWTIEPGLFVERWTGDGLRHVEKLETLLRSDLLPGFEVALRALFDE
jgi:Uma2 family endonuclease